MGSLFKREHIYIGRIQRRMFFLAFITAFAAAFTQTLAVLIDNVIVCTFYGESEIAAVALATPFFYLLEIPAAGLAAGIQIVCAKELGAGRVERVNELFNQLFLLAAAVLTVLTALAFLSVPEMAVLFGARGRTGALRTGAEQYLYGLSFEILPYVLFCILTPVVILDNGGRLVTAASVCGCLTDCVLDLLSVRFGWGLFGIGLASSASALVYFLVLMLHFLKPERVIRLRFVPPRRGDIREITASAAPKAWLSLADALCSAAFITLVSLTGGVTGTCVLSIHGTVSYFVMIFTASIAGAVGVLAGIGCGEKNGEELAGVVKLAQRYCLVLSAAVMAALAALARPLAAAWTESAASAELLRFALGCLIVRFPLAALVQARIGYLQAVGQIRAARQMGLAANLVFLVALGCLLALACGVRGVFMAFPAAQLLTLLVSWGIHVRRTGRALPAGGAYLEVDSSFFPAPGDVIAYPVETREECALASEQILLFCRGHGLPERKGLLAGLCAEELTTNVLEHGLKPRRVFRAAEIRVVIDGQDVIIRARDGGRAFNLKDYAERLAKERVAGADSGVRLLLHAAGSIRYYRTYGMNTTIVRV